MKTIGLQAIKCERVSKRKFRQPPSFRAIVVKKGLPKPQNAVVNQVFCES